MNQVYKASYCNNCPIFFKSVNSCPDLTVFESGTILDIVIEMSMSFTSVIAYLCFFFIIIYGLTIKTTRGFCIAFIVMMQVVSCEILKSIQIQARPYGSCSNSYGYPSSHTSFASTILTWLILEMILADKKADFKKWKWYTFWRNIFLMYAPLVPISGLYLNYHTMEQVIVGFLSGMIFAILFYIYLHFNVFEVNSIEASALGRFWRKYNYANNMINQKEMDNKIMKQINELKKKYAFVHGLKGDLLKQKEILKQRVSMLEKSKNI